MITSPTRPIACESDDIIENAPRSCRMSSAAIVSRRMRDLGERDVLGDRRVEVMAHHQHVEVLVDRVDRVRAASGWSTTAARSARRSALMMSGAWPPPAPSVWKVWIVRPLNAAIVSSTKPDSFSVSVWIATCTSYLVGDARGSCRSPPASCPSPRAASGRSRRPRPARRAAPGRLALPLPRKPRFIGNASAACSIAVDVPGPGRAGRRERAGRRARCRRRSSS